MGKQQSYALVRSKTPSGDLVTYRFTPHCCINAALEGVHVPISFDNDGNYVVSEKGHGILTDIIEECLTRNPHIEITEQSQHMYLFAPRNGAQREGMPVTAAEFLKKLVRYNEGVKRD